MGKWTGKYVIGLTGNIGTGKSVVRKMLEHLGAYGIDADALARRVLEQGAPGYQPVVQTFGNYILDERGQIDRKRLGRLVFSDAAALQQLEQIVHPYVLQAVDLLVQRSSRQVIVVEAIKLLESNLKSWCDGIWVTYTKPEVQFARLAEKRKMDAADARQRIDAQPPQERKMAAAQVVIDNSGSLIETWKQVTEAWQKMPVKDAVRSTQATRPAPIGSALKAERATARHAAAIAALINRLGYPAAEVTPEDILAEFGEKAFLVLMLDGVVSGLIGWQVENLIARTTDLLIDPKLPLKPSLTQLVTAMERASNELLCEVSLIYVKRELAGELAIWRELGYSQRDSGSLGVLAWQEAASESRIPNTQLFFKQLRQDRILRPI
ncbi:MAG: dephospho-CoA kinase [Anaerolineae bacterium]|nr:dephospho-CoA kinase [Anaerolineae bacterium]